MTAKRVVIEISGIFAVWGILALCACGSDYAQKGRLSDSAARFKFFDGRKTAYPNKAVPYGAERDADGDNESERAERLCAEAGKIPGIKGASAIISGKHVSVVIEPEAELTDENLKTFKEQVKKAVLSADKDITSVSVTADLAGKLNEETTGEEPGRAEKLEQAAPTVLGFSPARLK
ncbi:MAG: YhcN/YlaJ family sporulation lipoprotein [Clostridiales bacterium]|jgi:hypothetical protein|nr:YhcN/YlaJ family sporulation lipoprotein [Clostridiales bacterium]